MNVAQTVAFIERVLSLKRSEIAEWCGVEHSTVTKWIAKCSGLEYSGYGHMPKPQNFQKLRDLLREAQCVDAFNITPDEWRSRAFQSARKPAWKPVWEQFVNYSCASAKHYPQDDSHAAVQDLGEAFLSDDNSTLHVTIRSGILTGDASARCYGNGENWEVIVDKNLPEDKRREEALRELQAHVFHVKPNPDGLRVEQPLRGVGQHQVDTERHAETGIDESGLTGREANQRYRTWVLKRSNDAAPEKRAIARYVATHIVRPQMLIQIAPGTTENCLMDEIITNEIEDIQVTTNNLQVLVKGLRAAHLGISVNMTGGTLNPSIDSLIGPDAARVIADDRYMPHAVCFGAAGLSFQSRLCISYAFEDEEATQVAYATRPTQRRVLMADDSKLGNTCGRRAPVNIEQMMQSAEECIVVSNYKAEVAAKLNAEIDALKDLLKPLADSSDFQSKNFSLRLVDMKGSIHREYSLRGLRQGEW